MELGGILLLTSQDCRHCCNTLHSLVISAFFAHLDFFPLCLITSMSYRFSVRFNKLKGLIKFKNKITARKTLNKTIKRREIVKAPVNIWNEVDKTQAYHIKTTVCCIPIAKVR